MKPKEIPGWMITILLLIVVTDCKSGANDSKKPDTVIDNNKPQKEKKFRIQLLDMPARLQKEVPAEWEKYQNYRQHTMNYWNEIEESDYVKQLADEAFKKSF